MNHENIILKPDGKSVIIHDVTVVDEEIHKFLKETKENNRQEMLKSLIRTGCAGLRRMKDGSEIDFIERRFNNMVNQFERMFDPSLSHSFINRLISLLKEYFDKGGTVDSLLSSENGPLGKLKDELNKDLRDLKEAIIKKEIIEEIEERSPLKGSNFEDEVEIILSNFISRNIGDELIRTTHETGKITNCRSGDFVIQLAGEPSNRIVIEVKDCQSLSFNQIIEILKKSMTNRNAKYGILISKYKESLPLKIGWFNEYHQNMLICAMGSKNDEESFRQLPSLAIQWAKMRIQKEINMQECALENVADGIARIREKLERFSLIKTQCSNIHKCTLNIMELSVELRNDIDKQIKKIQSAISSFSEGGGQ